MIINHNLMANNAIRNMNINSGNASKSMQKLSSGLRINSASDDAAGLAISEKMRGQIRGLDQASSNAQDGISMVQTAEGALNETTSILQRMRELANQAANDTNVSQDRSEVQKEINQLTSEINRIGNTTEFNTQKVLNGGSGQTNNIRYSVVATGDPANSSATGAVSTMNIAANSVKAGTAEIQNFATTTSSQKAASAGTVGSPFLVQTSSTLAGTGKASAVTETKVGGTGAVTHAQTTLASDPGTAGVDTYQLTTNFGVGNTFSVAGQTFTAVDASKTTLAAGEFKVGATINATVSNLAAALNANGTISGDYTVSSATDTITLTETNTNDGLAKNAGASTVAAGTNKAEYALEITSNFTAGDKLKIGDITYTAGTDFTIGATIADTVTNIKSAIEAANDANDTAYDISITDPTWTGSTDNNTLVFTSKAAAGTVDANAADMKASAVTNVAATPGVYKFEVKTNFEAGQKIKIGDVELTAGTANSATTFAVGADVDTTAANLKAALDAAKTAGKLSNYNVAIGAAGIGADTITLTEASATGTNLTSPTVTNVAAQAAVSKFDLSTNFTTGDKITIDGVDLVAGTDFAVGATVTDTAKNLKDAINGNATLNTKFAATTENSAFVTGNKIVLTETGSNIDGVNLAAPTITKATAQAGKYEFLVNTNFANKDRIAIAGRGLTAGTDFAVGADVNATAANIKAAIENDLELKDKFTVAVAGNKLTLTEKVASGANISAPSVSAGAVAGKFEFGMNALAAGTKINIDGTSLTLTKGGSESETAAELKSLVENNSTLNAKYAVEVSASNVTLTQKAGSESATAPTLSYQTQAGAGFKAQMQIGANTGQSMEIDLKDMRSLALGVSKETSGQGQTVEVDGKKYAVAWTTASSVTNGTDSIACEYALDVSNHDNATAAVKVINDAINSVSSERAKLGAYQNRLEHTINNLGTASENLTTAESRIRDVDMAKEMSTFSKNNILSQAAQAMLAQANQQPQQVLQLLR